MTLVGNGAYCETLAKHLELIWFESLLEGEEHTERRFGRNQLEIYKLAHTRIIKKMMNSYSSIIFITTLIESAWLLTAAHVKGITYRKDNENVLQLLHDRVSYCVLVEDKISPIAMQFFYGSKLSSDWKIESSTLLKTPIRSRMNLQATNVRQCKAVEEMCRGSIVNKPHVTSCSHHLQEPVSTHSASKESGYYEILLTLPTRPIMIKLILFSMIK